MLSLLDKTVRTVKWHGQPLPETSQASVKETLNGDFVLTFTYPITDSGLYHNLKEDYLIRSPTPVLGHQLFRIKKVIEGDTSFEVIAYHISDDIMTRLLAPFRCEQVSCVTALSSMVMASKSPLGDFSFTSDIVKPRTYTADKEQTLYSALLDGKHSIVGTWEGELVRDNLALSIKGERGQDRGVVISTHYNLKKYQRTKESSQIITRIHASSTFKQEGRDRETVLQVTVDSPLINSYPFINEVTYTNNYLRTRQELIEWASAKFRLEGIDKPKDAIVIEAFELDGQPVHLGDTVTLKSKLHEIDMKKKAVAYDYDPLAKSYRAITFDDQAGVASSPSSGGLSTLASNLIDGNKRSEDVAIDRAIENANRVLEAEFEKRKVAIDDAIEQAQSHGEVYADQLKASIDGELSALQQQMRQQEGENNRTIRDLLAKAGANTDLATEAKQRISTAENSITQTVNGLEQLSTRVTESAGKLSQAETQIQQLVGEVSSKVSQTSFDNLKRTVDSQATSINQNQSAIALKAEQLYVDGVKMVADSALLQASSNQNLIAQTKAELRVAMDGIQSSIAKIDYDSLTGRISSAETTIRMQAGEITKRLTSTDVDSKLKHYATVTTFQEVKDTVTGHTRTIGDHTNQISQVVQTG